MKVTAERTLDAVGHTRKWSSDPATEVPFTINIIERSFESMDEAMEVARTQPKPGTWDVEPDNRSSFKTAGQAVGYIRKAIKRTQGWPSTVFYVYVDTIPDFEGRLSITIRN